MGRYQTVQGDTWDQIAYRVYGSEFLTPPLLEANPAYLDMVIFPSGLLLAVPELAEEQLVAEDMPPWRKMG